MRGINGIYENSVIIIFVFWLSPPSPLAPLEGRGGEPVFLPFDFSQGARGKKRDGESSSWRVF